MPFDYQPTLKGSLVELRPLCSDDHPELYAVAADPLIWEQHPVKNRHEAAVFREFFFESLQSGGALLATDAETQRVIGSSRFFGYQEEEGEVEPDPHCEQAEENRNEPGARNLGGLRRAPLYYHWNENQAEN